MPDDRSTDERHADPGPDLAADSPTAECGPGLVADSPILFDADLARRLYPRLERVARDLVRHQREYQAAGRKLQRLFLSLFAAGPDPTPPPSPDSLDACFLRLRDLALAGNFPDLPSDALENSAREVILLCVMLHARQKQGTSAGRP